ncbi:glutamine synthetase [Parasalinivibrio latis]|uniref:glutamine synthetase family protein n=1 Tax=Parasalinivibrio latis TaxID=2952610 RepID=UPI0030E30AE1
MLEPRDVKTSLDAKRIVEERNLKYVKIGLFDIDGVMRGKYLSKEKFFSGLDNGLAFCDVVLGWDSKDKLYDNALYTGWHTGYPDAPVKLVPSSCRSVPFEGDMLLFIAEFDGAAEQLCPRGVLKRVLKQAENLGFNVTAAFEYEFFMFRETPESIREKGYRNLTPLTPDPFGYSVIRNSTHAELYNDILQLSHDMDFPIEGLHTETGPGVLEAALVYDEALKSADKAALFKTFIKVWAQRNNLMATFMAKWSHEEAGQSGHIHVSMTDKDGNSVFFDPDQTYNMSNTQRHFLAGQQQYMPEFLAMVASTVNSYSRMVPGVWAPLDATWGTENRTTALRIIPGNSKSQRVEYRLGSADSNPYLALAAVIASGLQGIENELEPICEVKGNAYTQSFPSELSLPSTLGEAASRFGASEITKKYLGEDFVYHFAATRDWEEREFRRHVTDWELDRYFEII